MNPYGDFFSKISTATSPHTSANNFMHGSDDENSGVGDSDDEETGVKPIVGEDAEYKWKVDSDILEALYSYWNGERWAKADRKRFDISKKFQSSEFVLISWNVWFGTRNFRTRLLELGKEIQKHDPDLIAFQEMTPDFLKIITSQPWARQYFISDQEGVLLERYGNVLFSKVQFHECVVKSLESRMGRKACISTYLVRGKPQLTVGTFHLESYLEDTPYRAKQLQVFKEMTSHCSHVVLVGDTNFVSDSETGTIADKFTDAWPDLYHRTPEDVVKYPGITFDTETNPMLKQEYAAKKLGEKRQRLDRCFFTKNSVEVYHMEVLGQTPYDGNSEFISDHYGILVKFRFKDFDKKQS